MCLKYLPLVLFFLIIFSSCKDNEETASKEKKETSILRRLKKIEKSKREPFVEINHVIDTVVSFNLQNMAYELCYTSNGRIWFYDTNTSTFLQLPYVENAYHLALTKDNKTLYYTTKEDEKVVSLCKAIFSDTTVTFFKPILFINKESDRFLAEPSYELGKMIIYRETIIIQHDFEWMDNFLKTIQYSIKSDSALFDQWNPLFNSDSPFFKADEKERRRIAGREKPFSGEIKTLKSNEVDELFLCRENDKIQLTQTKKYDELYEECKGLSRYVELYEKGFDIEISPDGTNLLFSIETMFHEARHGPIFLVDLERKNKEMVMLSEDGLMYMYQPEWLPDGRSIVSRRIVTRRDNTIIEINADNYVIRKGK
jgi:hypothetical protein